MSLAYSMGVKSCKHGSQLSALEVKCVPESSFVSPAHDGGWVLFCLNKSSLLQSVYIMPVKVDSIFIDGFLELCNVWKTKQDKHKLH